MKKIILSAVAVLAMFAASIQSAEAIPARPGKFMYNQPDGTVITLAMYGDESYHWMETEDGTKVRIDDDGSVVPIAASDRIIGIAKAAERHSRAISTQNSRKAEPVTGAPHFLVILTEFPDIPYSMENVQDEYYQMLNGKGYSKYGDVGSVRDYFSDNSMGVYEPVFDVYGPVVVSNPHSYYGKNDYYGNDLHLGSLVAETCKLCDPWVDFSQYDADKDGMVDLVYVIFPGYCEADVGEQDLIWPCNWSISGAMTNGENGIGETNFDGVTVDAFSCSQELDAKGVPGSIAAFCHEFSHGIGLPDFYDPTYSSVNLHTMAWFSNMSVGAYNANGHIPPNFTAAERNYLGWLEFSELNAEGGYSLDGIQTNKAYVLHADVPKEEFVLECRSDYKWDSGFHDVGLLIYHLDQSDNIIALEETAASRWENAAIKNNLNTEAYHPLCAIIPSVHGIDENSWISDELPMVTFGVDGHTEFSNASDPYIMCWSGEDAAGHLKNIKYSDGTVSFDYEKRGPDLLKAAGINAICNPRRGKYAKDDYFYFKLKDSSNPPQSVVWYYDGNEKDRERVLLKTGEHTITAVLTYPSGETETLTQIINVTKYRE